MELFDIILTWQKMVIHFPFFDDHMTKDYELIEKAVYNRLIKVYKYCPELSEMFEMKEDRICYSSKLSEAEKQEILDFIDKNHTILFTRISGRR